MAAEDGMPSTTKWRGRQKNVLYVIKNILLFWLDAMWKLLFCVKLVGKVWTLLKIMWKCYLIKHQDPTCSLWNAPTPPKCVYPASANNAVVYPSMQYIKVKNVFVKIILHFLGLMTNCHTTFHMTWLTVRISYLSLQIFCNNQQHSLSVNI